MIYNRKAFFKCLPDGFDGEFEWDFLKDVWKGKIEPMDFDCVVERHGHFLVIETKSEGQKIGDGNALTFQALLRSPAWRLMVLYGKLPNEISEVFIYERGQLLYHKQDADTQTVRSLCHEWRVMAESKPPLAISRRYIR